VIRVESWAAPAEAPTGLPDGACRSSAARRASCTSALPLLFCAIIVKNFPPACRYPLCYRWRVDRNGNHIYWALAAPGWRAGHRQHSEEPSADRKPQKNVHAILDVRTMLAYGTMRTKAKYIPPSAPTLGWGRLRVMSIGKAPATGRFAEDRAVESGRASVEERRH